MPEPTDPDSLTLIGTNCFPEPEPFPDSGRDAGPDFDPYAIHESIRNTYYPVTLRDAPVVTERVVARVIPQRSLADDLAADFDRLADCE